MRATSPQRQALVVSGGGAGAAYGVGIMKALIDGLSPATGHTPLDPHIYTGTSGGAFNAAFMSSKPELSPATTIRLLEQGWVDEISDNPRRCGNAVYRLRGNPLSYLDPYCFAADPSRPFIDLARDAAFFAGELFRRGLNFLASDATFERRLFEFIDISTLIDDTPFRRVLPALIDLGAIRRSPKTLRIISTDWRTGEVAIFGNADLTDEVGFQLLQGSAAIPGVFQPVTVAGATYVDGGLVMNVPLMPAIEAGADILHVIYYDPDVRNLPIRRSPDTLDTIDRSRMIDWATRMNEDIETARWINEGLELIERFARGEEPSLHEEAVFIRVAAKIDEQLRQGRPYRKLVIHRYHPGDDPAGPLGLLNFERPHLERLIERGFSDAVEHDCDANKCILVNPDRRPTPADLMPSTEDRGAS